MTSSNESEGVGVEDKDLSGVGDRDRRLKLCSRGESEYSDSLFTGVRGEECGELLDAEMMGGNSMCSSVGLGSGVRNSSWLIGVVGMDSCRACLQVVLRRRREFDVVGSIFKRTPRGGLQNDDADRPLCEENTH